MSIQPKTWRQIATVVFGAVLIGSYFLRMGEPAADREPVSAEHRAQAQEQMRLGNFASAEASFLEALSLEESQRPLAPTNMVVILNDLGLLKKIQGDYEEAVVYYDRAYASAEQHLGKDDPLTGVVQLNLGEVNRSRGELKLAMEQATEALRILGVSLGESDSRTISAMNILGLVCTDLKQYDEAENHLKRALKADEKVNGANHSDVGRDLGNLGYLYCEQGRFAEAEEVLLRAVAIDEATALNDLELPFTLNNLAYAYKGQGKYAEAEALYRRVLALWVPKLGHNHPHTQLVYSTYKKMLVEGLDYTEEEALERIFVQE